MLCAYTSSDEKVIAKQTEKNKKPFFCPECLLEVILKKGNINIHHFAHKPGSECSYGEGESEEHMRIKMELYELLSKTDIQCDLEKRLVDNDGSVNIADVWAIIDGQEVAIEVQISSISDEELEERTKKYHNKNIAVLWLVVKNDTKRLNSIEKWLKINTNKVYYYYKNSITNKELVNTSDRYFIFTLKKYNLTTDFMSCSINNKTFYVDKESFEEIKAYDKVREKREMLQKAYIKGIEEKRKKDEKERQEYLEKLEKDKEEILRKLKEEEQDEKGQKELQNKLKLYEFLVASAKAPKDFFGLAKLGKKLLQLTDKLP